MRMDIGHLQLGNRQCMSWDRENNLTKNILGQIGRETHRKASLESLNIRAANNTLRDRQIHQNIR